MARPRTTHSDVYSGYWRPGASSTASRTGLLGWSGSSEGVDDLLAVQDNQRDLVQVLRTFFEEADTGGFGALPISRHETLEKDHGRIEIRQAVWVSM